MAEQPIKIIMSAYGSGWEFTITELDEDTIYVGDEEPDCESRTQTPTTYRTGRDGCGLWLWCTNGMVWFERRGSEEIREPVYEWRQIEGTCQFSLSRKRSVAYQQIRRRFL